MRCPKCGFISFDQLPKCVKCGKNFSGITELVHGTAFSVTAPLYLKIQEVVEARDFGDDIRISDEAAEEFEIHDPDLDILFEEEGEPAGLQPALQLEADGDVAVKEGSEFAPTAGSDEEEGEISIDLSQFQNDLEGPALGGVSAALGSGAKTGRQLPEELSDMSDLAPPSRPLRTEVTGEDDEFDFSLDLDGLDDGVVPAGGRGKGLQPALELGDDDFDFSLDLGPEQLEGSPDATGRKPAAHKTVAGASDPELDLVLDLDLGRLSLDKD